jgi:outer membrane protein
MKSIKIFIIVCISIGSISSLSAQSDSLSLQSILTQVMNNYPSIKKEIQDINAADARLGLAKSTYLPDVFFNSSYTRIGPVSSMTLPGLGTFELYPANNYSATLNYNQTLYDFGRTSNNIELETQNRQMISMSADQTKQKLSSFVIDVYYSIVYLQEAITIKDEQIKTLNEHLRFVEKKKETGSATQYEVLTTQVKISTIENQKTDLQAALEVQISRLQSLLGNTDKNSVVLQMDLQPIHYIQSIDSLSNYAYQNRPEIKLSKQKESILNAKYEYVNSLNNPMLNLYANGGIKNGYTPEIDKGKLNYAVGIGLKIPIYDANRTKLNLVQVTSDIENNKQDIELAKRNILNEVVECQSNIKSATQKINQSELQLNQAQQAYNLAENSFKSGVITNLELLDSFTSLSESKLSMLKARIDYSVSYYKLQIALGEKIY